MVAKTGTEPDIFYLPDLGEGLDEAEIVEWCVEVGQRVRENDILARMETAKALVDLPSPRGGTIAALHGRPGDTIKVGSPIVTFRSESPAAEPARTARPAEARPAQPASSPPPANPARPSASSPPSSPGASLPESRPDAGTVVGNLAESESGEGEIQAAPAVRRLARELGVDLAAIRGTGVGGRITSQDVRNAISEGQSAPQHHGRGNHHDDSKPPPAPFVAPATPASIAPSAPVQEAADAPPPGDTRSDTPAVPSAPSWPPAGEIQRIPFRGVRRAIADHLRHSIAHAVHFTVMDEVDLAPVERLRLQLIAASGEKLSILPFAAAAVCHVLAGRVGPEYARLNSTVDDDRQEIVQHKAVHLGIATDTDSGLMVPVIFNADRLGIMELGRQIAQLAAAARGRTLRPDQLRGSTFTLSNFGSAGGRFATPIINYPETGILAVGRAREGVVVRDGMLGVGRLLPLSLSADHRVIDGALTTMALAKIMELLARPDELLTPAR